MLTDCIFCRIAKGLSPSEVIFENEHIIAFLDITPDRPGHTLVIPKQHAENLDALGDKLACELISVVKKIAPAVAKGVDAHGYNLGMNNGAAAGQIIFHAHMHIIPRTQGDGLEMWEGESYKTQEEMQRYADAIRGQLAMTDM